ncbi:MAG: hypothetical protein M1838_000424 [Thelocarpon superellum]|nr:MAG: hypothetical protein M1838_000424 [Thelocarpon superellum]
MASPAKRRRKNDSTASPSTTRSLDYFFGRQQQTGRKADDGRNGVTDGSAQGGFEESPVEHHENGLSDEDLARRLQEEWNQETSPAMESSSQMIEDLETRKDLDGGNVAEDVPFSSIGIQDKLIHDGPSNRTRPAEPTTLSLQSSAATEDTLSSTIPLDESPLTFDPAQYVSELQRHWAAEGGHASYALLTRCFVLVNSTQSRIKIVDNLVNLLRVIIEADPASLLPAVWLATNAISPPYVSLELGLGGSAISKALKKVCGLDNVGLKVLYNKHGDAGDVAFEAKKRQSFTLRKPKPLTIQGVYQSLVKIAHSKGNGSQEVKQRIVDRLLQDARGAEESRYIVRTLVQHLRIGAVKTTMLIALSRAFLLSRAPQADHPLRSQAALRALKKDELAETYARGEEMVKACFARRPNYNDLVPALLEIGVTDELLLRCGLALHIPLRPMLGSITRDLSEMLTKLQGRDFSCEYKYDGQRAQVHCDARGKVSIFSRHLELMTDKYPDLVALVPQIRGEGVDSFIMEGEVVAMDHESGEMKTFQTLAGRGRKDVVIGSVKVDVCLFAFDLMFLNGEELLDRPFRERRELLRSLFTEIPRRFTWVRNLDASSSDSEAVLEFFKSATDIKCEGIMVKVLDNLPNPALPSYGDVGIETETVERPTPRKAPKKSKGGNADQEPEQEPDKDKGSRRKALLSTYEPDKRLDSWLKVKKDYNTTFDTLDLIPVAAWHGSGRKAKWWSPILLACRNPGTGSLEAVCKCISGFTDKFYADNKARYAEGGAAVISRPAYVDYIGEPDVWFEPQEVWEMAFADVTISPTYTAAIGLVSEEKGLSLRFPRFLKVREDKSIDEASTSDFLAGLWRKQEMKPGAATVATVAATTAADAVGKQSGMLDRDEEGDQDAEEDAEEKSD